MKKKIATMIEGFKGIISELMMLKYLYSIFLDDSNIFLHF